MMLLLVSSVHAGWEELPPLPAPTGGFLCGVDEGRLIVVGGTNWENGAKNWLSAVHEYDPAQGRWRTHNEPLPHPLAYGTNMQDGSHFRFLGGSDGKVSLKVVGTIEEGHVRLHDRPKLPGKLVLAAGGCMEGRMIFAGGTDDAANIAGVTRAAYLIEDGRLQRLPDYPGKAFAVAASAIVGGDLFVFGGMNHDQASASPTNTATAFAFASSTSTWRALRPLPHAVRGMTAVVLDSSHIYLGGGFSQQFTAEAFIYDVEEDAYQPATPLPYAAMVQLVRLGDFVYCLGGEDKMKSRTAKFYRIPVNRLLP